MGAFMKLATEKGGNVKGEATDEQHKDWILLESMNAEINRSIAEGAQGRERRAGNTSLFDVRVVRHLDKSSLPLQAACGFGDLCPEVEIHFCTQVKNKQEPHLIYKLKDVIITRYCFEGVESGDPLPKEELSLSYTQVELTQNVIDPDTGDKGGSVQYTIDVGRQKA